MNFKRIAAAVWDYRPGRETRIRHRYTAWLATLTPEQLREEERVREMWDRHCYAVAGIP